MNDDLISRQAARYNMIENMLSVQSEQKTGRWELSIGYHPKRKFMCDQCTRRAYEASKYCPNCGAKMKGVK